MAAGRLDSTKRRWERSSLFFSSLFQEFCLLLQFPYRHPCDHVPSCPGSLHTAPLPQTTMCLFFILWSRYSDQKQLGGGNGSFDLTSSSQSITEGSQSRTQVETRSRGREGTLLACRPMLSHLPYTTQATTPRDCATHSGLGPPTPINNQESPSQGNLI